MEWDSRDQQSRQVMAVSEWQSLENYQDLEPRAGVYIFADAGLRVKYIGKAGAGRMVEEIATAILSDKAFQATRIKALYTNSDVNAWLLEAHLIDKYDPPNNRA
jgi:excinuclease UvrABC nuclease subunit